MGEGIATAELKCYGGQHDFKSLDPTIIPSNRPLEYEKVYFGDL